MNPCPCGHYGDPVKECTCSLSMVKSYPQARKSPARCTFGRIDTLRASKCRGYRLTNSATNPFGRRTWCRRAGAGRGARTIQRARFKGTTLQTNSDRAQPPHGMEPAEIRQFGQLDQTGTNLIKAAMQQMQLSARAYHRTQRVKLARTIAG